MLQSLFFRHSKSQRRTPPAIGILVRPFLVSRYARERISGWRTIFFDATWKVIANLLKRRRDPPAAGFHRGMERSPAADGRGSTRYRQRRKRLCFLLAVTGEEFGFAVRHLALCAKVLDLTYYLAQYRRARRLNG